MQEGAAAVQVSGDGGSSWVGINEDGEKCNEVWRNVLETEWQDSLQDSMRRRQESKTTLRVGLAHTHEPVRYFGT